MPPFGSAEGQTALHATKGRRSKGPPCPQVKLEMFYSPMVTSVSYTHLDVYKRQVYQQARNGSVQNRLRLELFFGISSHHPFRYIMIPALTYFSKSYTQFFCVPMPNKFIIKNVKCQFTKRMYDIIYA